MRFEFITCGLVPDHVYEEQARVNLQSGVPYIELREPHDTPLAIVGGGPSAGRHLAELQEWPGHVWAINQGAAWLAHAAPKARVWMFTVDPDPILAQPEWIVGVQRAILGLCASPKLFEALKGKELRMFDPHIAPATDGTKNCDQILAGGPSSVCRTFVPAATLGYKDVTYFGCEGSMEGKLSADGTFQSYTHAYRNEDRPRQMIVRCGDKDFVTTPDLYLSTIALANFIKAYPLVKEKSGGLLRGMIEHADTWEVVALSEALRNQIDPSATERWGTEQLARVAA